MSRTDLKVRALRALRRSGHYLPRCARSLWFFGSHRRAFSAAEALVRGFRRCWPQYRLVLSACDDEVTDWAAARFKDDAVLPAPRTAGAAERFVRALAPRALIQLDDTPPPAAVVRVLENHGLPILRLAPLSVSFDLDRSCLAAAQAPDPAYVRRELGLPADALVIAVSFPSSAERAEVCEAFAALRRVVPSAVLLLESPEVEAWRRELWRRGWRVTTRSARPRAGIFDAMLLDVPAEMPGLAAAVSAVVLGGTFSGEPPVASPAWFAPLGVPVVVGRRLHVDDAVTRSMAEAGGVVLADSLAGALRALATEGASAKAACERARSWAVDAEAVAVRALDEIMPLLPDPPQESPDRQGWRIKTRVDRFADTRPGRWLAEVRSRRRIDSWEALRTRLGQPRVLLCLGNGPSSEDPRLHEVQYDRLFRVNWRWQSRGFLNRPDVVFVGDPRTVHHLDGCLFAFGACDWERTMLLRHLLALRWRAPEYFTLERLPSVLREHAWWARPSNGALMIAAAAALQPERIVIAGIDLFEHPDGRYPGDLRSTNDYAQVHRRDVDLAVIRQALKIFRGQVQVVGGILENALGEAP